MKKYVQWSFLLFVCMILFVGCQQTNIPHRQPGKLLIYTSLYPLQDFAEKIGKEHVQVINIIPPGVEPHDFELSAQQMGAIQEADLVLLNGNGFEPWAEKAKQNAKNSKQWVDTSQGLPVLKGTHKHSHEEHEHENEDHGHEDKQQVDPHLWLNPQLAKKQAKKIEQSLITVDPKHKNDYQQNGKKLATQFDQLNHSFQSMVAKAKKKEFVVSHEAFSYLAHQYGLKQIAVSGLSPTDEPAAKDLEEIIQTMKQHKMEYIFFETLVHPKVAETIRREVNATALTLNPLEGLTQKEIDQKADYFSVMEKNRQQLAKALESSP